MQQRLQKILSAAGIASRRAAEEYITQGRVMVNGTTDVSLLGTILSQAVEIRGLTVTFERDDGQLLTSHDATTWTASTAPDGSTFPVITHGGGRFVAATAGGSVYSSTDAVTWAPHVLDPQVGLYAAAYGNGRFVVAGTGTTLYTSTDASTWTARSANVASNSPSPVILSLAYGNGRLYLRSCT